MSLLNRSLPRAATLALTGALAWGCIPNGAKFAPATGVLTIGGTSGPDSFVVSVGANGRILVNGGGVPITGGVPTVANTTRIVMAGKDGDDQLVLDPMAALPGARLVGGPGTDVVVGGAGDDEFVWAPGDGRDTIEGQGGTDALVFNGSSAAENFDVVANGGRVLFLRNVDSIQLDLNDVETIEIFARAGADAIVAGDLTGTEATQIRVDLAGTGGEGDGVADSVTVNGTNGVDVLGLSGEAGSAELNGTAAAVRIANAEPDLDRLTVNALGGHDIVDASATLADAIQLTMNGGLGDDTFLGGAGNDRFNGGDGDDDAFLGAGDDTFTWNPGDDDDVIEGETGFDTLTFNGANIAEVIEIAANGGRIRFTRNVANVITDLNDVESIDFTAVGGADLLIVNDLSGTDLVEANFALGTLAGTGDGAADTVIVRGTNGDDVAIVAGDASGVAVLGLAAQVNVTGAEAAADSLTIGTFAGDDVVDASALATPSLQLTADGGVDHDILIGGDGADVLLGDEGDDVLLGGPGLDVLDGGPGDNVVIQ